MEILNPKNPVSKIKKKKRSLYGLTGKLETTKELMNLRTDQQKSFNMNKEKQVLKNQQRVRNLWDNNQRSMVIYM